jgi:UDP-N-acetylmuramoyl-L-alanyl-D-glutamate--2,6-diaminopimelate ligase
MKLGELLQVLDEKELCGDEQQEITSIVSHSGSAGANSLFVAVPGLRADGHDFLEGVYQAGTRAFVTQKPFSRPDAATIRVPDSRRALSLLAAQFYGHPSRQARLIGITGTNGKTTTTYLIESILRQAGFMVGVLGTVEYRCGSLKRPAVQTTLEPMELQKIMRDMVDGGAQYMVMEVSSQGLDQRRVDGCQFDAGVFTNLTPEHLDYHETLENYFQSKERFFTRVLAGSQKQTVRAVINRDDPRGRTLLGTIAVPLLSFGLSAGDIRAASFALSPEGIRADIHTPGSMLPIESPLLGMFNLSNILAAAATAVALDIAPDALRAGIEAVHTIPGRMERIENARGMLIVVDYAHTGDALENALKTLQDIAPQNIITVFGCGGDRDREKRPVMGSIAARCSDMVIITSDNPRSEEPEKIIQEIEAGVLAAGMKKASAGLYYGAEQKKVYAVCPDRAQAIARAVSLAQPGDIILIAGKGHETFQQIGDKKFPFDDRDVTRRCLEQCLNAVPGS